MMGGITAGQIEKKRINHKKEKRGRERKGRIIYQEDWLNNLLFTLVLVSSMSGPLKFLLQPIDFGSSLSQTSSLSNP
jgi:hypothetical protein